MVPGTCEPIEASGRAWCAEEDDSTSHVEGACHRFRTMLKRGKMSQDERDIKRRRASTPEDEEEGRGKIGALKADLDRVASGAALALEVAGLKTPTRALGKKRLLVSGGLSFLFGPLGFLYAAPLKEAIPAIVVYVAAFWLLSLVLPTLLLVWPLAVVNVLTGVAGALYAWGFNSAGKRVPMVLKEPDGDAPPLRRLLSKKD